MTDCRFAVIMCVCVCLCTICVLGVCVCALLFCCACKLQQKADCRHRPTKTGRMSITLPFTPSLSAHTFLTPPTQPPSLWFDHPQKGSQLPHSTIWGVILSFSSLHNKCECAFVSLSLCLSVCLSLCLLVCLSVRLSVYLSACLSLYISPAQASCESFWDPQHVAICISSPRQCFVISSSAIPALWADDSGVQTAMKRYHI